MPKLEDRMSVNMMDSDVGGMAGSKLGKVNGISRLIRILCNISCALHDWSLRAYETKASSNI